MTQSPKPYRRRTREERELRLRYCTRAQKKGEPQSARRRFLLIRRRARWTRLIEEPEKIAHLSNASLELVLRIITHAIHGVPERVTPLLDVPEYGYFQLLKRTPEQFAQIHAMSRQTEAHAQKIFKNAVRRNPLHPGHDLFLPLRGGRGIEIDVKQSLKPFEYSFLPVRTPFGKLYEKTADEFVVFTLNGLVLIRKPRLKLFLEKYREAILFLRYGNKMNAHVPVGVMVRLGFADVLPYREDNPCSLVAVPRPPHFPSVPPLAKPIEFLGRSKIKRTPPSKS